MKKEAIKNLFERIRSNIPPFCLALISGWLCSLLLFSITSSVRFTTVSAFADQISLPLFLLSVLILSALFFAVHLFSWNRILLFLFPVIFIAYGAFSVANYSGDPDSRAYAALVFCLLAAGVIAICVNYMKSQGITLPTGDISSRMSFISVSVAFTVFSAVYIAFLGARTDMLLSPCYDMGIFAQMYENMTETLLPITTCERGFELSHFDVHFSPALYLLLPFCYIFDVLDVLVFAQILLVFSAVFPLWLICKRVGLSNILSAAVSLLFLLYPAMSSGGFYDFHENAFLAPFILWTLYFIHAEKWIPAFIFAAGVLTVKEDAAMYVVFIALYVFFARRRYWQGALMLALSVGYFLLATHILLSGGQGTMLGSRFFNVIGYDGSFSDLIRVAMVNPAIYAAESFTAEKLLYTFNMLLPLAFLPLMTKKPSRWLLVAPLFVMNLISDYQYQYDIGFQYSFGSGALLVYLATVNLSDIISDKGAPAEAIGVTDHAPTSAFRQSAAAALTVFALFSSVLLMSARFPSHSYYLRLASTETETVEQVKEILAKIDRSKSVTATSMYLTPLYDVDELYHTSQVFDSEGNIVKFTDVVVLDAREYVSDAANVPNWTFAYRLEGYAVTHEIEDVIIVMERKK